MSVLLRFLAIVFAIALATTLAQAQNAPLDLSQDGPWIDLPEGVVIDSGPPSYDQIVAMADLDGDPTVMTADEVAMIALLMQVLGSRPVTD